MDLETRRRLNAAIVRLADGDRSAFPDIFQDLWPPLRRFVARALGDRPDVEDVAQQALVNLCFRIAEFDRSRDGVAWAFGIAAWEVRTCLRKVHRRREAPDTAIADVAVDSPNPEEQMLRASLRSAVMELIDILPERDRETLLGELDGPAGRPATPAQRKRRQRALSRLRDLWSHHHD
jgi:RNA polymerase sigma-70 factor (ECF subfamily)